MPHYQRRPTEPPGGAAGGASGRSPVGGGTSDAPLVHFDLEAAGSHASSSREHSRPASAPQQRIAASSSSGLFAPMMDTSGALFEMHYVDPADDDQGPLSVPAADDYPIGARVRMHDECLCQRAMGDAWRSWMAHLTADGFLVNVRRHLAEHTVIDGWVHVGVFDLGASASRAPSPHALPGLDADGGGCDSAAGSAGGVYFRLTVPRAVLVGPRISDAHRYPTPSVAPLASLGIGSQSDNFARHSASDAPTGQTISSRLVGSAEPSPAGMDTGAQPSGSLLAAAVDGPSGLETVLTAPSLSVTMPPGVSPAALKAARDRGNQLYRDRFVDQAITAYTQAIEIAEQHSELTGSREHVRALSCRSAAYMQLRRFDDAFADATRIIEVAARSVVGYVRAGHVKRAMRLYQEADNFYAMAMQLSATELAHELQLQRDANAQAAVLGSSLPPSVDIVVDPNRISVVARREVRRGERIFCEAPVAAVPVWELSSSNANSSATASPLTGAPPLGNSLVGAAMMAPRTCPQCCSTAFSTEALRGVLVHSGASQAAIDIAERLAAGPGSPFLRDTGTVACDHNCGVQYCSERCRAVAWDDAHWAECTVAGAWANGMRQVIALFAQPGSTFAKVFAPHTVLLAIRALAVYLRRRAGGSGVVDNRDLARHFRTRTTTLLPELSANELAVVQRVHETLARASFSDATKAGVTASVFVEIVEYVRNSALQFAVSPYVWLDDSVATHIELLEDRPSFAAEGAERHLATLRELRGHLPSAATRTHTTWLGSFRILGACRRADDPPIASFSADFESSVFVPRPFSPATPAATAGGATPAAAAAAVGAMSPFTHTASVGAGTFRQSSTSSVMRSHRRQPNATFAAIGATAVVAVTATRDVRALAPIVLDAHAPGGRTASTRTTPNGSVHATPSISSGSHQSMTKDTTPTHTGVFEGETN